MKFRNQARLCLAIHDFEARSMLSLCLTFQGTRLLGRLGVMLSICLNFHQKSGSVCL